jgi:two-component system sensor histidine kinase/response regulator
VLFDSLMAALDVRAVAPAATPETAKPARRRSRALLVLLAEDSVPNQKVARGFLERWGHRVTVVDNGRQAVALLTEAAHDSRPIFDLVLMDVQMPEMDGLEATRVLRERGVRLPIVAMTANALKGDRERCLEAGMDDYVAKPLVPDVLFDTIERWASHGPARPSIADAPARSLADGFDAAALIQRFEGDHELAVTVVQAFLEEAEAIVRTITTAMARADLDSVRSAAHRLKGSVGHVSADAHDLAARLEALAREGNLAQAASIAAALTEALDRLAPKLREFVRTTPSS